jgi:predicted ATPase
MQNAAYTFRYNRRAFITPPWREIFRQDHERRQDFEAVRTYDALAATYSALDYDLVEIPRVPVEQRMRFVLDNVGAISTSAYDPQGDKGRL